MASAAPALPPDWQTAFLRALERTGTMLGTSRSVGVAVTTAYAERRRNPRSAAEWTTISTTRPAAAHMSTGAADWRLATLPTPASAVSTTGEHRP